MSFSVNIDELRFIYKFDSSTSYTNFLPLIGKTQSGTVGKIQFFIKNQIFLDDINFDLNKPKESIINDASVKLLANKLIYNLQKKLLQPNNTLSFINLLETEKIARN